MQPEQNRTNDLPEFAEPDLRPWTFKVTPGPLPVGPISAISAAGGMFFYAFKERIAHGALGEGLIALAALALMLGAIVWVVRDAASPTTRKDDAPESRARSPNPRKA